MMTWLGWILLVLLPRLASPLLVLALLFTTRWQIGWIARGIHPWLNVPFLLIGLGAIALNLNSIWTSWRTWTWRGDLSPRVIRHIIERRRNPKDPPGVP